MVFMADTCIADLDISLTFKGSGGGASDGTGGDETGVDPGFFSVKQKR